MNTKINAEIKKESVQWEKFIFFGFATPAIKKKGMNNISAEEAKGKNNEVFTPNLFENDAANEKKYTGKMMATSKKRRGACLCFMRTKA